MKQILFVALMLSTLSMTATESDTTSITQKSVDTETSTVAWVAKKVTGQHNGTINIKEGLLDFKDGVLKGGTIVMDMTTIANKDMDKGGALKLEGHLKSDDFFSVPNHPTSTLVINKVVPAVERGTYTITADLTIKGITKPISFNAQVTAYTAAATLTIDRSKFDVKYGSGSFFDDLGDKMIYDDFELSIVLNY